MRLKFIILIVILLTMSYLAKSQERIPERLKFDWKEYNSNSTIGKDSIKYDNLQGIWIAYEGCYIGEYKIGWKKSNKPKSLQIKGDKYRKSLSGEFSSFQLDKNLIIFNNNNLSDSAYINLISDKELIISFRNNSDYEQYYYTK